MEPPHTVLGDGAHTGQVVLVGRNILPLSPAIQWVNFNITMTSLSQLPCDGIESLLDLGSNGEEYRNGYQVNQACKHPLLLLKLLDLLPVKHSPQKHNQSGTWAIPEAGVHQVVTEFLEIDVLPDTPKYKVSQCFPAGANSDSPC